MYNKKASVIMGTKKITKEINYIIDTEIGTTESVSICESGNTVTISNATGNIEVNKYFFESFIGLLAMFQKDNNQIKQNINLKIE
jgi:hypothetical protein|nr:MAG TPA: hypothetical protein [Caudoviricetes sp.]